MVTAFVVVVVVLVVVAVVVSSRPEPELPPPTSCGWTKTSDSLFEPHWTTLHDAAKTCYEHVSCKCKGGCVKHCKCRKAALECTALRVCEGKRLQN